MWSLNPNPNLMFEKNYHKKGGGAQEELNESQIVYTLAPGFKKL